MAKKILIVEDDPGISLSLKDELEAEGFGVITAADGNKGLASARKEKPDLILLDLMLPEMSGLEVCKTLRGEGNTTPVIMLTVRDREVDKVLGLELGADDYVTKPFSLRELVSRIKAVLRRAEERTADLNTYTFGEIALDFKKYEARRRGQRLDLTPLEFKMLKCLIQKRGQVVTRDDFLDKIWGEDNVAVSNRTVDSHIANIRKKIEDDPARPKYILGIRGVGYKFTA